MSFIGVDVGAGFIKGAVLQLDPPSLARTARLPFPEPLPGPPGSREYDPAAIGTAVATLLDQLAAPVCRGIVLCGQMHGLVLADDRGKAVSNFISWQDQRSLQPHPRQPGSCWQALQAEVSADERRRGGNELRPGLPLTTLHCLALAGQLPAGAIPASLPDYLAAHLCATAPLASPAHAAASGAYDLDAAAWQSDLLRRLGLDELRWPELAEPGRVVGETAFGGRQVPVYVAEGDQQCALLGTGLLDDELSLNVATGCQVSRVGSGLAWGDFQTRPYFAGRYLRTITHIPAGRSLNALLGLLTELARGQGPEPADPWDYINRAAAEVVRGDLEVDLSFFPGAFGERGSIAGIREQELTVGHLFHAAFANIAEHCRRAALRLPGDRYRQVALSGGLVTRLGSLRAAVLEQFPGPWRLAAHPEDTLLGLLILALVYSGGVPDISGASRLAGAQPADAG